MKSTTDNRTGTTRRIVAALALSIASMTILILPSAAQPSAPEEVVRALKHAPMIPRGGEIPKMEIEIWKIPLTENDTGYVCGSVSYSTISKWDDRFQSFSTFLSLEDGRLVASVVGMHFMTLPELLAKGICNK